MQTTVSQLKQVIREEIKKARTLNEMNTDTTSGHDKLEDAIVEYLEYLMLRSTDNIDEAYELLMVEVEATFKMFSANFRK